MMVRTFDAPRAAAPASRRDEPRRPRPRLRRLTRPEARALVEIGMHVVWEREYRRGW